MNKITTTWRLHRMTAMRTLRSIFLLSTALYVVSIRIIIVDSYQATGVHVMLATIVYLTTLAAGVAKYLKIGPKDRLIIVRHGNLSIPRSVLNRQIIPLHHVKSIETLSDSKKINAIVIGRFNKSTVCITSDKFVSQDEFQRFYQFLNEVAFPICSDTNGRALAAISGRSREKSSLFMGMLVLLLALTYIILAGPDYETTRENAVRAGGLTKGMFRNAEFYRLASSFFLHATPLHLILNILSLSIVGQFLEIILGRIRFVNILFLSAVSGALLSFAFSPNDIVIGASGGIFGLVGGYLAVCTRYHRQLPGSVSGSTRGALLILGLQILLDLVTDGTDIFSHLGGICFGVVYVELALRGRISINEANESRFEKYVAVAVTLFYLGCLVIFLHRQFP